jgi:hypothetical protein
MNLKSLKGKSRYIETIQRVGDGGRPAVFHVLKFSLEIPIENIGWNYIK